MKSPEPASTGGDEGGWGGAAGGGSSGGGGGMVVPSRGAGGNNGGGAAGSTPELNSPELAADSMGDGGDGNGVAARAVSNMHFMSRLCLLPSSGALPWPTSSPRLVKGST